MPRITNGSAWQPNIAHGINSFNMSDHTEPVAGQNANEIPFLIQDFQFASFDNEKQMCDYIENNIKSFIKDAFGKEYKNHTREYYVTPKKFGHNTCAVDFMVETVDGLRIFLEIKNPQHIFSEITRSISQLLTYGALADYYKPADKLVLVTSNTHTAAELVIQKYELPIEVVLFNKEILATWDKEWGKQWAAIQ